MPVLGLLCLLLSDLPAYAFAEVASALARAEPIIGSTSIDADDDLTVFLRYQVPPNGLQRDDLVTLVEWFEATAAELTETVDYLVKIRGTDD